MEKFIFKLLFTSLAVFALSHLLNGVEVDSFNTALLVAFIFGVFRVFVRPILIFITIPITIVTFGLFLFAINAILLLMISNLLSGFEISGFFTAILFSLLLSFFQTTIYSLIYHKKNNHY